MTARKKITPLHNFIVVRRVANEQITPSGIIIPDTARDKSCFGCVVATGPGKLCKDGTVTQVAVTEGDTVIFNPHSGMEVRLDGSEFVIIAEDDIFGRVISQ